MDSQEATDNLRIIHKVLTAFQTSFWEAQRRSGGLWKLQPRAPFDRLDAFLARCEEMQHIKMAVLQFGRLERIEIGGSLVSLLACAFFDISDPPFL